MWKTFTDNDDDLIIIQDNPEESEEIKIDNTPLELEKENDSEENNSDEDLFDFSVDDIKEESLKEVSNWSDDLEINPTEVKEDLSDDFDLFADDEIEKIEKEPPLSEKENEVLKEELDLFWDDPEEEIEEEKQEEVEENNNDLDLFWDDSEEEVEEEKQEQEEIINSDILEPLVIASVLDKTINELIKKWRIDAELKTRKLDKKDSLEKNIKELQAQVRELNKEIKEIENQEAETKKVIDNLEKMKNPTKTNSRKK